MTIAAGFKCSDGVLLASDTLYSNTGTGLRYGPKLWILDHGDVLVVFGGAGPEARLLRLRDEIDRKLKSGMSRIKVVDTVDMALQKVAAKLPRNPFMDMQALVAIRIQHDIVLYETQAGIDMLNPIGDICQCVGFGQGLGWYFARSLFRTGMEMKWAKIVAAYLIKQCKDYSESCGGETHIIEVPHSGPVVRTDDQQQIGLLEHHLAVVGEALGVVLPTDDPRASDVTIDARLRALSTAISEAKRLIAVRVSDTLAGTRDSVTVTVMERER
jgi:hypothetical protein